MDVVKIISQCCGLLLLLLSLSYLCHNQHRESVKKAKEADDPGLKAQAEPVEEAKRPENSPKRKKPSSIFSMDKWMGRSSGGAGSDRGVPSLTADDLDMESLTNQSLGPTSQSSSQLDRPSLELEGLV